eukprot:8788-Heterococcus_DN1.PRE.2
MHYAVALTAVSKLCTARQRRGQSLQHVHFDLEPRSDALLHAYAMLTTSAYHNSPLRPTSSSSSSSRSNRLLQAGSQQQEEPLIL